MRSRPVCLPPIQGIGRTVKVAPPGLVRGTLVVLVASLLARAALAEQIKTDSCTIQFDVDQGRFTVMVPDKPLLTGAVCRAVTASGPRTTAEPDYQRTAEAKSYSDQLGPARQLIATCKDTRGQLDIELRLTAYAMRPLFTMETICTNTSALPISLPSIEPVSLTGKGSCSWPGTRKILTNGKMYYDAGRILTPEAGRTIESWWNVCLYTGEHSPALVAGYLENKVSLGRVLMTPAGQPDAFALTMDSGYGPGFTLEPGQRISSDRVIFCISPTPYAALESYGQAVADLHQPRLNPPINGWCSWFSVFGNVTEQEVLRNAEFAARHLKPYGLEYIQLDDGFYRAFGDWEGNAKFPHGMKWLAGEIRKRGLKPGIWFAPFVVHQGTDIHKNHPDWLVRRSDGTLRQIAPNLGEESPEGSPPSTGMYALDPAHPQAAAWLRKLFETAADDWGYDFFKIDFVDWSLLTSGRFHDDSATRAGLYRQSFGIMREAIGPDRHLLDCGPGPVTVGLIDSMRIELDQPPVTWTQYFLQPASSGPAMAKRYYYNGRTWYNDADMLVMDRMTIPQCQAAATLLALSGGNAIAGDRLTDLDTPRLEILKKMLPAYGHAARPVDMFEQPRPEIFALRVKKRFGEWLVLALFNVDEQTSRDKTVALDRLGLDPAKTYIAYDFWQQRFFGEVRGKIEARLPPSSVLLLSVHEKKDVPQVISTDRHITQGGVDLENLQWDAASTTLRGTSVGPPGSNHYVYIHLPEKHPWAQGDPFLFHDRPGYTLRVIEPQILRIQVRFDDSGRVTWEFNHAKFFGGQLSATSEGR